ncbi:MAG: alpha/beta fold hydrolase [Candidatus Dormibacterales bacterium]
MREPKDGSLERAGVTLHYVEWPAEPPVAAEPPILLLHGLSSNSRYWDRVAVRLSGRRVIALDQRGHGLTGRAPHAPTLPKGFAMRELVEDVAFMVAKLGLDTPVVVGHSWGATVALEVVATQPGLASGLVFIDGPVQSASNLFSWDDAQRIMQPTLPRFADFAAAVAESRSDFGDAWGEDLEAFVKARIVPDAGDLILTLTAPARYELLKGLFQSHPDVLWPQVDVPAAVLLALRSFARISRSTEAGVDRLGGLAAQIQIKWFDTPHDIPLFLPAEIAAEIERVAELAAATGTSEPAAG